MECLRTFREERSALYSTEAVLTEALHLLAFDPRAQQGAIEFFAREAVELVPADPGSIRRCGRLMRKYADVPMDYADATLVVLAEDLGTDRVFTLDRRSFDVFRWKGRRPFRVVPGRA